MDESTLLSIKKFSAYTGLSVSTLRYYDEIGILPPAARGENNYRHYRPIQIITANFIQVLVELGIPLATIRELSENRTPEDLIELLGHHEDRLDFLFNELRTAYSVIHTYRKNILAGLMVDDGAIKIEQMPVANYRIGVANEFTSEDSTFYAPFINFCKTAQEYNINLKFPVGALHHNMDNYIKAPGRPDLFISMDPLGNRIRPAGEYMIGYKRGYYGQLGDLAQQMEQYAREHSLYFHGPVFTVYLLDEISVRNPDEYLSSVSVRVSTRKTDTLKNKSVKNSDPADKLSSMQFRRSGRK